MFNHLKKLQSKRFQWYEKTPKQKWQMIYDFTKSSAEIIGIHALGDMKNNWYSATIGLIILFYISTAAYTIYYYTNRGEFLRGSECLCCIGIVVTVSSILTFFFTQNYNKNN